MDRISAIPRQPSLNQAEISGGAGSMERRMAPTAASRLFSGPEVRRLEAG